MFYYVYKITNQINGKFYIGAHSTKNLDDGYMGSGKRIRYAINKYGVENFSKEILGFYDTKVKMYLAEKEIVKLGDDCYNLVEGGGGIDPLNNPSFENPTHSPDHMMKMSKSYREKLTNEKYKKEDSAKRSKSQKNNKRNIKIIHEKISNGLITPQELGWMISGSKHSAETKLKMSSNRKGKGKKNQNRAKPICDENGIEFSSVKLLCENKSISDETARRRVKQGIYKFI